jgi:voltage-gated potassium channel
LRELADWLDRHKRLGQWLLGAVALMVVPVMIVEESSSGDAWKTFAVVANWVIWVVFALDLLALILVAGFKRRWKALAVMVVLDALIVGFSFPLLPKTLQSFRAVRVLRLLPLLRLGPMSRGVLAESSTYYVVVIVALAVLLGGTAFHELEGKSAWQGVYWGVVTMTTVGYGDYASHTDLGKALSIGLMLFGIGFVTLATAAVAERMVRSDVRVAKRQVETDLDETESELLLELRAIRQRLDRVERSLVRGRE